MARCTQNPRHAFPGRSTCPECSGDAYRVIEGGADAFDATLPALAEKARTRGDEGMATFLNSIANIVNRSNTREPNRPPKPHSSAPYQPGPPRMTPNARYGGIGWRKE